jgi:hypothetical protein
LKISWGTGPSRSVADTNETGETFLDPLPRFRKVCSRRRTPDRAAREPSRRRPPWGPSLSFDCERRSSETDRADEPIAESGCGLVA